MSKLRVQCFSMSVDGFGAGPDQSLQNPLSVGERLFEAVDLRSLGYCCAEHVAGEGATHVVFNKG